MIPGDPVTNWQRTWLSRVCVPGFLWKAELVRDRIGYLDEQISLSLFFLCLLIYFERAGAQGREREGERESQVGPTSSREPNTGLEPPNRGITT